MDGHEIRKVPHVAAGRKRTDASGRESDGPRSSGSVWQRGGPLAPGAVEQRKFESVRMNTRVTGNRRPPNDPTPIAPVAGNPKMGSADPTADPNT